MSTAPATPTATTTDKSTGIVLSGGGARGAYEAGVVLGLTEVLTPQKPLFDVLCGTSVGALNAAYLAAHAHLPDMNAPGLVAQWRALEVQRHLTLDMRGLLGWKRGWSARATGQRAGLAGRSLLDPHALEDIARQAVPWDMLHDSVQAGRVRALVVSALHIGSGRTTLFSELAPGVVFTPSRDPRRGPKLAQINADHVLASAAIPLLFPARRIGDDFYCDGGLRFNTPIAPAIRVGAERLVVVSLLSDETLPEASAAASHDGVDREQAYNSPAFLIGKVLNALLLDPLRYDLQVLDRFNRLIGALEEVLPPEELAAVQRVISESRGLAYRRLSTLVFRPSRDIGALAREHAKALQGSRFSSWLLARAANLSSFWESDVLSFILFDSAFAQELIELGRTDVLAREDEVRRFFAG